MNRTIKHVVVTGGAGLIGSEVVWLLNDINLKVSVIDKTFNELDISGEKITDVLDDLSPDFIVHAAAHPGGKSLKEPVEDVSVNALGSMRIFDWCERKGAQVIFTSSSSVYGEQPKSPIKESALLNPGTVYAVSKVACENWLKIMGTKGLSYTVLRLFSTFGNGHKPNTFQGILNIMLTQLLAGDKVIVKGSLQRQRDLLYVEDAADAIIKTIFSDSSRGMIINIGTGIPITIEQLILTICEVLGRSLKDIEIIEEVGTVGDPDYNVADISVARKILSFEPKYSVKEGLISFIENRILK